jgi:hypothetical protein
LLRRSRLFRLLWVPLLLLLWLHELVKQWQRLCWHVLQALLQAGSSSRLLSQAARGAQLLLQLPPRLPCCRLGS